MPTPFTIKASVSAAAPTEIFIYGDIGEGWDDETIAARTFVRDLAEIDADELVVRINSYGGSVTDGLAIYNALKRHKATVHVEIDGIAASIASLIAMAGDTIRMAGNALMMIHAPWGFAIGNAKGLRDHADVLDKYANAMANSYTSATDVEEAFILGLLLDGEDHYFTAQEAADANLIHEITAELPIAAHIEKTFDLTRYARFSQKPAAAAANPDPEEPAMPKPVNPAANPDPAKTPTPTPTPAPAAQSAEEIKAQVLREETERRTAVMAQFQPFADREGMTELQTACLNDVNITAAEAGNKILAALAKGTEPIQGRVVVTADERDVKNAAKVDALLARAGVPGFTVEASNPYRGAKLLDLARDCAQVAGVKVDGMDQMKIVAMAFTQSTSDFPILLEDAMHKTLQAAYAAAADTWSRFCQTGSVSDFRAHNRYRLGSLGNLDKVNENGEFKDKSIPDGEKASVQADTVGNIINLTRKMIVNDDLGAFIGLANMLGRSAARTVESTVYKLLLENSGLGPTMADGKTLFHADHNNIGTAGALSVAALEDLRVKMASQKDISGNEFLDIRPQSLVLPMGLGGNARVINDAQYDPDTSGKLQKPNMVRGLFSDIIDTPRLTGTRFYGFASAADAPVIEVSFLDGNQTPFLDMQEGFRVDGTQYKVRLDFGVTAVDYRGAVTNAGQ